MTTHRFRLYPSNKVEEKMLNTLETCRRAYNFFLGELNSQKEIDRSMLQADLPALGICDSSFKQVYQRTLQMELYKLFSNLSSLVATKKQGRKVGSLRFKGKGWFKTFTYNQYGFKLIQTGKRCQTLQLSKIGQILIRCHREVKGNIKQVTVKREQSGKWFASLFTDEKQQPKPNMIQKIVGIDVGLTDIVFDSDGKSVENPRHLKKYSRFLRLRQKKLSHTQKGSKNRMRQRIKVARVYERITNTRNDFLHKLSHHYTKNYDAIGMEDMPMTLKGNIFAKSKSDVAWGRLRQFMAYKAANAGKLFVPVNYRGTTQRCSQCGTDVPKDLSMRQHDCPQCGFSTTRDHNSALEIKRRMLLEIGLERPESTHLEMEALPVMATSVCEE
jgi:putative transposase